MSKLPDQSISQLIPQQLPEFVRDRYPIFVDFMQAYYEWLETYGIVLLTGRALGSTPNTLLLPSTASNIENEYVGKIVWINNGPAAGQSRRIIAYDAVNKILTTNVNWNEGNLPIYYSSFSITDTVGPGKILEYSDVDWTVDAFFQHLKSEFMAHIPGNIVADPHLVLKYAKQFYQARGSEKSFRFLFRILFNEDVDFYYPKVDLFRISDGVWYVEQIIRITTTSDTFAWVNKIINGAVSGTTAYVESVKKIQFGPFTVSEIHLTNIVGDFYFPSIDNPEQVFTSQPAPPPPGTLLDPTTDYLIDVLYPMVVNINVTNGGTNYAVGDPVTVTGGGGYPATAVVTSITETIYTGISPGPPGTLYLEPYFAVAIPGIYFFDDVLLDIGGEFAVTGDQIALALTETDVDDFFAGDPISLTQGTGAGQVNTIVSYDGNTKVATCANPWSILPDATTQYSITHKRGALETIQVTEFGVGFTSQPTVNIQSNTGSGGAGEAVLGVLASYPGTWIGTNSMPSNNKRIQDSYYWQDFSYVLKSSQSLDRYIDAVKKLLPPAGMKLFGEVDTETQVPMGQQIQDVAQQVIILLDNQSYSVGTTVSEYHDVEVVLDAGLIGTSDADIDRFKFIAYPPNPSFDVTYPWPNQNYWNSSSPGNTQISHFENMVIGDFVADADIPSPFVFDSYITISDDGSIQTVGPIGPTRKILDLTKFTSFAPSPLNDLSYGPDNEDYFDYGNTQLSIFADTVIGDIISAPYAGTSVVPDSYIAILGNSEVPIVGELAQYQFQPGVQEQVVYNICPNTLGEYNAEILEIA